MPYQLRVSTDVRIRIHDVSGQLVRRLVIGARGAGDYLCRSKAAYWDGRNDTGESVGSGVYWYSIDAGGYQETRKMVIQR